MGKVYLAEDARLGRKVALKLLPQIFTQDRERVLRTDPGKLMGTARYMSPEQIRGLEADGISDVFSLGVVLYEMVTGRAPFDGTTIAEVMAAILYQEPLPLRRYTRNAPAELERIVGKALQKDREERYQVIKDLLLDLKSLKLELEVEAKLKRAISPEVEEEAGQIAQPPTPALPYATHPSDSSGSAPRSFDLGKVALLLQGIPEENTPELRGREGADASKIILVSPP